MELERTLTVVHGVVPGDAQVIIPQERKVLGIEARDPLLTARSIFPETNGKRFVEGDRNGSLIARTEGKTGV